MQIHSRVWAPQLAHGNTLAHNLCVAPVGGCPTRLFSRSQGHENENAADASARETERAPNVTRRVNATIYKYTPHERQAAKGTLEWWTTILSDPSAARRYWNVYSTFVSLPSKPVK